MRNQYGVLVPKDGPQLGEIIPVGDGIDFSMDDCNRGHHPDSPTDAVMAELKAQSHDGYPRDLHYWDLLVKNIDPLTLDEYWPNFEAADNVEYLDFRKATEIARKNMLIAANPPYRQITYAEVKKAFEELGVQAALDLIGMTPGKLLTTNPKLDKGGDYRYYSIGLMLSPGAMAGLGELCPFRSWACTQFCLNDSGQGETYTEADFNAPQEFRKKRTLIFMKARNEFWFMAVRAIKNALKKIDHGMPGFKLCVRMNVLSDRKWESEEVEYEVPIGKKTESLSAPNIMSVFPDIWMYDYTKQADRMYDYLINGSYTQRGQKVPWPKNYHLTYSLSENNMAFALWVLENGGNVAVPFDTTANKSNTPPEVWHRLPSWWSGHRVIDGDISDMRFLDAQFFTDPENAAVPSKDEKKAIDAYARAQADMEKRARAAAAMNDKALARKIRQEFEEQDDPYGAFYLTIKGSMSQQIMHDVKTEISNGRGLVVGLRLKGTKNKSNIDGLREAEIKNGFAFGELTGGFVQYSDVAGMRPEEINGRMIADRIYIDNENKTMSSDWISNMILVSEARRLIQSNLAGVIGLETQSFSTYKKTETLVKDYIRTRFGISQADVKEMALRLADNLVRADDIIWKIAKWKPQRTRWTPDLVKFLKQKIG